MAKAFHELTEREILALAISLLLAFARMFSGRLLRLIDSTAKEDRLLEAFSGRGLTCAVIAVIATGELSRAGIAPPIDLQLLALFVVFFTNAISTFLVLRKRPRRIQYSGGRGGIGEVLKGGLHGA